eukprot:c4782_g1_i1.p1 GENE.c4782_g1_i1~~c4782_g1_i1.p1  ORF type:complete len:632 (+),score=138.76 c4782_g1_i1:261-1898(+)
MAEHFEGLKVFAQQRIEHVNQMMTEDRKKLESDPKFAQLLAVPESSTANHLQTAFFPNSFMQLLFFIGSIIRGFLMLPWYLLPLVGAKKPDETNSIWRARLRASSALRSVADTFAQPHLQRILELSNKVNSAFQDKVSAAVQEIPGAEHIPVSVKKMIRARQKIFYDYLPEEMDKSWYYPWTSSVASAQIAIYIGLFLIIIFLGIDIVLALLVGLPTLAYKIGRASRHIIDGARATVICETVDDCNRVHSAITNNFDVVRVKNRWHTNSGYADMMYNVRINNVICEIQVTHKNIFQWRGKTHQPYKILRAEHATAFCMDENDATREQTNIKVKVVSAHVRVAYAAMVLGFLAAWAGIVPTIYAKELYCSLGWWSGWIAVFGCPWIAHNSKALGKATTKDEALSIRNKSRVIAFVVISICLAAVGVSFATFAPLTVTPDCHHLARNVTEDAFENCCFAWANPDVGGIPVCAVTNTTGDSGKCLCCQKSDFNVQLNWKTLPSDTCHNIASHFVGWLITTAILNIFVAFLIFVAVFTIEIQHHRSSMA